MTSKHFVVVYKDTVDWLRTDQAWTSLSWNNFLGWRTKKRGAIKKVLRNWRACWECIKQHFIYLKINISTARLKGVVSQYEGKRLWKWRETCIPFVFTFLKAFTKKGMKQKKNVELLRIKVVPSISKHTLHITTYLQRFELLYRKALYTYVLLLLILILLIQES